MRAQIRTVADLIGLPASEHDAFVTAADRFAGSGGPQALPTGMTAESFYHLQVEHLAQVLATCDTELYGVSISAGDKVAMFYCSGNRDETVFPNAGRLDLQRARSAHVAFGGGGAHFCFGSGVAKS